MTVRLYLMRHATAEAHGSAGADPQRALTQEGRAEARGVGKGLKRLKIQPGQWVTSPYLRARQTAEEVAKSVAPSVVLQECEALVPDSDPQATAAQLKAYQGAEELICFGHEPHMSAWVAWLVDKDAGMNCLMKKASVACIEVDQLPPPQGSGVLRWLLTAKQLALIGKAQ